ncbi:four helix bundle protein [Belliella pelovolcani]|uniref:Four helix bundle protein n=1 Tax=Belliella pelovolcani TaxID=529505 RepID=A0A1N7MA83_9BACT|nr:four helix bundle protein [Belliella pelovolcani]SIS82977.1 four helix bundle protein [Belliella pelovolcani]
MGFQTFEDLEVWKKSRDLRIFVKKLTLKFPNEEKYVLGNQVLRSSRSIGNNIAEGYGRYFNQENIQFCRIARGSLEETLDHLIIAFDEGYISTQDLTDFRSLHNDCLKLLNGYISYLKKAKSG